MDKEKHYTGLNIKVGDYIIRNDSYQYIVNKVGYSKAKQEETITPVAYYGLHNFGMVKDYLIKHMALDSGENITTIKQLNELLSSASAKLNDALQE